MNVLKFVFGHRGVGNLVRRTAQIASRFGHGPQKMGGRFERFVDVLDEAGVRPTFPITALPMSRNPAFAHRLIDRGAELAVHAWSHIDLTTLDYEGQREHMGKAIELFREHAVPFTGFRAPYLHWNDDTMRVVEDYRYAYSSNLCIWWDVIDESALTPAQLDGLRRGLAFYKPQLASETRALPFRKRGFVEIPVSLPDDEIPLDRMYIDDAEFLGRMWLAIFEKSHERGELFTLQLHPERIDFFAGALRALLQKARGSADGVWVATLDEISQWWLDKSSNRVDFVREGARYRADIKVCEGTAIYIRSNGTDRLVSPGTHVVEGDARPCVGVSPGSDRAAIQALADLGYVVEVGDSAADFAVHLGHVDSDNVLSVARYVQSIKSSDGPIVHFGIWPLGARSALAVTGDIDALTIWDFFHRFRGA